MSYIVANNPLLFPEHIEKKEIEITLENKINNIESMLKLIVKKLHIETEKKPVDLIELYGLKPLSFYKENNID